MVGLRDSLAKLVSYPNPLNALLSSILKLIKKTISNQNSYTILITN